MTDHLDIIKNVTDEHESIKGNIKLVGDTIADTEAKRILKKLRSQWIPGQLDILSTRMEKLKAALNSLKAGLDNHFAFEEESFPPILGDMLMQALLIEHRQIKQEISDAEKLLVDINFEGLAREGIIAKEMQVQQVITRILHIIENHADKEETVMEMLRKTLEHRDT